MADYEAFDRRNARILISTSLHDADGLSIDDNGELRGWKDLTEHVSEVRISEEGWERATEGPSCGAPSPEGDCTCQLRAGHQERVHVAREGDTVSAWRVSKEHDGGEEL